MILWCVVPLALSCHAVAFGLAEWPGRHQVSGWRRPSETKVIWSVSFGARWNNLACSFGRIAIEPSSGILRTADVLMPVCSRCTRRGCPHDNGCCVSSIPLRSGRNCCGFASFGWYGSCRVVAKTRPLGCTPTASQPQEGSDIARIINADKFTCSRDVTANTSRLSLQKRWCRRLCREFRFLESM